MKLVDLVEIRGNYTDSIDIKINFEDEAKNAELIDRFLPSESSVKAISSIVRGMDTSIKRERAHLITGSYGVGKSLTGLVVLNLFTRPKLKEAQTLINRIKQDWPNEGREIEIVLGSLKGCYLPVVIQGSESDTVNGALLSGLRSALNIHGLSEITPKIAFNIAIERIRNWRDNDKTLYKRFEDALKRSTYTPMQLESELETYSEKALSTFEEVHKTVTTAPFEFYKVEREPREFYSQVVNELSSRNTGFCGIMVIWDEYGETLKRVGASRDLQSGAYLEEQHFCQYCKEKYSDQVHYVSVAHLTQREYFLSDMAYQDYRKSSGRLTEYIILHQRAEEINGRAILQLFKKNPSEWQNLRMSGNWQDAMQFIKAHNLYQGKDEEWIRSEIVEGAFPLHPSTTYCLPKLSDNVSQLTRTSLSFLNDLKGLAGFIKDKANKAFLEPGRLNFFTVDKLYDYFGKSIEESKYRKVSTGYSRGSQYVGRDTLQIRILKTIAVLQVIHDPSLLATEEILFDCLYLTSSNREKFEEALAQLVKVGAIRKRTTGDYCLYGGGDYDYMEEFRSKRKVVEGQLINPIKDLDKSLGDREKLPYLYESDYNDKFRMDRDPEQQLVTLSSLSDISSFESTLQSEPYYDGWVLWVVAQSNQDIAEARALAQKITNKQIVIAIPSEPTDILDKLIDKMTADEIENNLTNRSVSLDPDDVDHVKEKTDHYDQIFLESIETFTEPSKLICYWQGNIIKKVLEDTKGLRGLVSTVWENVFPDTLKINQDRIAFKWLRGGQKKDRLEAIDKILDTHNPIQLRRSGGRSSAAETIIKSALFNTGLLKYRGHGGGDFDNYDIDKPEKQDPAYKTWIKMHNTVKENDEQDILSSVVQVLRLPPFGLSKNTITILLAAWLRYNWSDTTITNPEGEIVDLTGDAIDSIVESPTYYHLLYEELTYTQRQILNSYLFTLTGNLVPGGKISKTEITNRLCEWYNNLTQDRAKAEDISEKAREVIDAVGKIDDQELEVDDGLFNVIPKILGFTSKEPEKEEQLPLDDFPIIFGDIKTEIDGKEPETRDPATLKNMLKEMLVQYPKDIVILVLRELIADYSDDKSSS